LLRISMLNAPIALKQMIEFSHKSMETVFDRFVINNLT